MTSSSDDSQAPPPQGLSWARTEGQEPRASAKPDATPKMRGLFAKNSIPPPPAGRGPADFPPAKATRSVPPADSATKAAVELPSMPPVVSANQLPSMPPVVSANQLPSAPPIVGAPELPNPLNSLDDPLGDLFGDGERPVAADALLATAPAPDAAPKPMDADTSRFPPERGTDPQQVAKLGLAKTVLGAANHEIRASIPSFDPRVDPDSVVSSMPKPPSAPAPKDLTGVVFDPDQSVARHLGEVAIDGEMGRPSESHALDDLPLPQVSDPPAAIDAIPVRSSKVALMVIALVLVSGGIATLVSLGVLGGSPAQYRKQAIEARTQRELAAAAPAAAKPPATPKPAPAPEPAAAPTPPAEVTALAPAEATPQAAAEPPATAPAEPAPEVTAAAEQAQPAPEPSPTPATPAPAATGAGASDEAALLQALAADPRDHHAMEGLARIAMARGDFDKAADYAEQMIKRRPKRAAYRVLLGQALEASGSRSGAADAYRAALELEPDNQDALRGLGQ